MAECTHENADHMAPGEWSPLTGTVAAEQFRCVDCKAWLSLGPARHTTAVLVELRAAELATSPVDAFGDGEWRGWQDWPYSDSHEDTPIDEWSAGWLANEITSHGKEVAETRTG